MQPEFEQISLSFYARTTPFRDQRLCNMKRLWTQHHSCLSVCFMDVAKRAIMVDGCCKLVPHCRYLLGTSFVTVWTLVEGVFPDLMAFPVDRT